MSGLRLSDLFLRNRRLLVLAIGLIVVAGLSSVFVLPRMEDPVLAERAANITTIFPGADAVRVETLVTERIEDELAEIDEIKEIRSTSRTGVSTVFVELRDDVYDVDPIWSRVRDRVADASLKFPPGAGEPEFDQLDIKAFALIVAITWDRPDEVNYAVLRRLAEDLEDELRSVRGTEKVQLFGDPQEEITVEFHAHDLASLGLTAADVAAMIEASDAKVASGQLRGDRYDLLVEIDAELDSISRIGRIPIQSDDQGGFARLSDVATVTRGIADPPGSLAVIDGRPGIALGVLVRPEYRVDYWTQTVLQELDDYQQQLPEGVEVEVIMEQNRYVQDRLSGLFRNLVLGGAAVTLVILLMMGWRSALIVGGALPLASLMVLAGLRFLSIPIHQMSVTGLIIALGLLIDNAIVVVDEVMRRLRDGASPSYAVSSTVRHLFIPLFGSTLTTALAFAPIATMPGPAGEFVGSIAISVILAIGSSFLLAMTITPALAAIANGGRYLNGARGRAPNSAAPRSTWREWFSDGFQHPKLTRGYHRSVEAVLAHPWRGVLIGLALPMLGFFAATQLPEQFFPPAERDQIQIELELPPEASLHQTLTTADEIRLALLADERVERVHWFVGESAPTFYYNVIPRRRETSRYAQALIELDPPDDIRALIHRLQARVDREFPGARVLVRQLEQGPPFDAPIEVRISGPDLERLTALGDEVRQVMMNNPRIIHTRSELADRLPKLAFEVDEEHARLAGLDHLQIARQLESSLEGATGGSVVEATEELPVRVRVYDENRAAMNRVESVDLVGRPLTDSPDPYYPGVPITSLASVSVNPEVAGIQHFNGRRINELQGFVPAGTLPSQVLSEFQQDLADSGFRLPPGYELQYGGEASKRDDAVGNLMANVGVLVVLMIATLVLSFGSFRIAAIISLVAFLAVGLGTLSLWVFGFSFGFMAIVGTMGLIGVAINDTIVVLAAIRADERARRGDRDAIGGVVVRSTRHVLATSLTTMAGFSPLVLAGGDFWPPLAIAIAGGVGGATILALFLVPALYVMVMCRNCTTEGTDRVEPVAGREAAPDLAAVSSS